MKMYHITLLALERQLTILHWHYLRENEPSYTVRIWVKIGLKTKLHCNKSELNICNLHWGKRISVCNSNKGNLICANGANKLILLPVSQACYCHVHTDEHVVLLPAWKQKCGHDGYIIAFRGNEDNTDSLWYIWEIYEWSASWDLCVFDGIPLHTSVFTYQL